MFVEAMRGAIAAQFITTVLVVYLIGPSSSLKEWYRTLGLSAMAFDVLSLSLATYVGLRLAPEDHLLSQVSVAVLTGIVHDLTFGYIVQTFPRGSNRVMDLFKKYANEKKLRIVFDDALMIAGAVTAARVLVRFKDATAMAGVLSYLNLLLVYSM